MTSTLTFENVKEIIDSQNCAVKSQSEALTQQAERTRALEIETKSLQSQVKYLTFLLNLRPAEIKEFVETYLKINVDGTDQYAFCDNKLALEQAQTHMKSLEPNMVEFQNKLYHRMFTKVNTGRNKKRKTMAEAA